MSKLTAEQKAANKAAQQVRDRAFSDRRRKYRDELEAAKESAEQSDFARQRDAANDALEKERCNWLDAQAEINRQIAELQDKLNRTKESFALSIEPKKAARDAAWKAFREFEQELADSVDARFPDMHGCYSAAGWDIPDDVRRQMDAAAKSVKNNKI